MTKIWTPPRDWIPLEDVTSLIMDQHVRDNLDFLNNMLWDSSDAGVVFPAAAVTTPSLPQNYRHLLCVWQAQTDDAVYSDQFAIVANGVHAGMWYQRLYGQGSTATVARSSSASTDGLTAQVAGALADAPGGGITIFPDYTNPGTYPLALTFAGGFFYTVSAQSWVELNACSYRSAHSSVSTLEFSCPTGSNLTAPSRFSVYGLY